MSGTVTLQYMYYQYSMYTWAVGIPTAVYVDTVDISSVSGEYCAHEYNAAALSGRYKYHSLYHGTTECMQFDDVIVQVT